MRRNKPWRLAAVIASGLALLGAGVAYGATAKTAATDTLNVGVAGEIGSLDPAAWRGNEPAYIEYQIYETLMKVDPRSGKIVPGLAKSVTKVTRTKYVVTLRPNVKFSDGTPMTSADVIYSYQRALKKDLGAWNGAEYQFVKSYKAAGPTKVTITLSKPDNLLLAHLSGTMGVVVSKAWGEKNGDTSFATKPMGTGPYSFVSQDPSQVVLRRNPNYWGPKPAIQTINFKIIKDATSTIAALQNGEVDTTFSLPLENMRIVEKASNLAVKTAPSTLLHFMYLHEDTKPLQDLHVRKAIAFAIDTKAALKSYPVKYLEPATGSAAAPIALYGGRTAAWKSLQGKVGTGNLNAAKAELAKSSAAKGFSIDLTYENDVPMYDTFALYVQQQLKKLKINVKLTKLPPGEYTSRAYAGKLKGMELSGWYNTYPSPAGILLPLASKAAIGSTNRNAYTSKAFEKAADVAQHGSVSQTASALATMARLAVDDVVFLPVAYAANVQVSTKKLSGPPLSPILIWQPWSLQTKLS